MMSVIHVLAGGAVASQAGPTRRRAGTGLFIAVFLIALISHFVLDGIRHGHYLGIPRDLAFSAAAAGVMLAVSRRKALCLAGIAGSVLPDAVDQLPRLAALLGHPQFNWSVFHWSWLDQRFQLGLDTPAAAAVVASVLVVIFAVFELRWRESRR